MIEAIDVSTEEWSGKGCFQRIVLRKFVRRFLEPGFGSVPFRTTMREATNRYDVRLYNPSLEMKLWNQSLGQ